MMDASESKKHETRQTMSKQPTHARRTHVFSVSIVATFLLLATVTTFEGAADETGPSLYVPEGDSHRVDASLELEELVVMGELLGPKGQALEITADFIHVGQEGSIRAADGMRGEMHVDGDESWGTDGLTGKNLHIHAGQLIVEAGGFIAAGSGGAGGNAEGTSHAIAGDGGDGGSIILAVGLVSAAGWILPGAGGAGGNAIAVGSEEILAAGGEGGSSGGVYSDDKLTLDLPTDQSRPQAGDQTNPLPLDLECGPSQGEPGRPGTAGDGGRGGNANACPKGTEGTDGTDGHDGEFLGQTCTGPSDGTKGGDVLGNAEGGRGGDSFSGTGGNGGDGFVEATGGEGGDGGESGKTVFGNYCEPGGDGGNGGDATASGAGGHGGNSYCGTAGQGGEWAGDDSKGGAGGEGGQGDPPGEPGDSGGVESDGKGGEGGDVTMPGNICSVLP